MRMKTLLFAVICSAVKSEVLAEPSLVGPFLTVNPTIALVGQPVSVFCHADVPPTLMDYDMVLNIGHGQAVANVVYDRITNQLKQQSAVIRTGRFQAPEDHGATPISVSCSILPVGNRSNTTVTITKYVYVVSRNHFEGINVKWTDENFMGSRHVLTVGSDPWTVTCEAANIKVPFGRLEVIHRQSDSATPGEFAKLSSCHLRAIATETMRIVCRITIGTVKHNDLLVCFFKVSMADSYTASADSYVYIRQPALSWPEWFMISCQLLNFVAIILSKTIDFKYSNSAHRAAMELTKLYLFSSFMCQAVYGTMAVADRRLHDDCFAFSNLVFAVNLLLLLFFSAFSSYSRCYS